MLNKGFGSDNHASIHPKILQAIIDANVGHAPSYGTDAISLEFEQNIKKHFGEQAHAFIVFNGTAANVLCLKTLMKSHESVVCTQVSHINVDECGAPEFFTGGKIIATAHEYGKMSVTDLENCLIRLGDQHFSQPRVLSITQPTELGTTYSLEEIQKLIAVAKKAGMHVHIDGARFANACAQLKTSFRSLSLDLGVDAISFGGTKNSLMGGEVVILFDKNLARDFKYIRKQAGQLPSKTRFIAAQFNAYLKDNLWLELAQHSNKMAQLLAEEIRKTQSPVEILYPVQSNAVFCKIPKSWIKELKKLSFFYVWDEKDWSCRLMTSWDTEQNEVQKFCEEIQRLNKEACI